MVFDIRTSQLKDPTQKNIEQQTRHQNERDTKVSTKNNLDRYNITPKEKEE